MGSATYSVSARTSRALSEGYHTKSVDQIFTQNTLRVIHESMDPKGALIREARDSDIHPNSLPIILGLDLTGSMGHIPHDLVKDGLPTLMGKIIQECTPDAALLFLGIGDHEVDRAPLQVGQFESGDAELDLWLTRTYIEGGGGGNMGESYLLAWYYAAMHTATDAWEKRKQKGFLFTVGDEPCLRSLPDRVIKALMGSGQPQTKSDTELLEMAKEKYNVFHLHVLQGSAGRSSIGYWKELMGDNCIAVEDFRTIPTVIANTLKENYQPEKPLVVKPSKESEQKEDPIL